MNEQPYKLPKCAPLWVRNSSIAKQKEWHEEYNAKKKAYRQVPKYKAKERARKQTTEYKAKRRACQQTPEYKAYRKAYQQTPEQRAYQKAYQKAYYSKIRQDKHCLEFFQAMNTASEIARNAKTTNQ